MKFIFYDLETNSLDTSKAAIMQICMMDEDNNILMNNYVYPYDGNIDGTAIHGIDKDLLDRNSAIDAETMLNQVLNGIKMRYPDEDIYLVAYNNFGYDQQVLEYNFNRFKLPIPKNWFFTDLLPYIKDKYPQYKFQYRLFNIYEKVIGELKPSEKEKLHDAKFDIEMMKALFDKHNSERYIMATRYTRSPISMQSILHYPITVMDGYDSSNRYIYIRNNIKTIGDLYNVYQSIKFNDEIFDNYLKSTLYLKSNFHRKKTMNEMANIKFLCI